MKKPLCFALVFLLLCFNFSRSANAESSFRDVRSSHWAKDSIELLSSRGIISGYSGNVFKPDAYITREEAALMLGRVFNARKKQYLLF